MASLNVCLCALAALFCLAVAQSDWEYGENGTAQWVHNYPECGLPPQSPIALDTYTAYWWTPAIVRSGLITIQLFDYHVPAPATVSNNGHTVIMQFDYTGISAAPRIVWTYNGNSSLTLYLRNITTHWPAEHWINNESFEGDIQMLHTDPTNSVTWILSYVYKYCAHTQSGMDQLSLATKNVTNAGESVVLDSFAPQTLMPYGIISEPFGIDMCDYIFYVGSLTSPPCTRDIAWFVYAEPLCVSHAQIDVPVYDSNGDLIINNARPLQPREDHFVSYITCTPA